MSLITAFRALSTATSAVDFSAFPLSAHRADFLAKSSDGGPVFLLQDSGPVVYSPAIELEHVSVQFHSTCRVTTAQGTIEDQFAVISCDPSIPELFEMFVRCLAAAVDQLPLVACTLELQHCVQSLLGLFRALSRPSNREVAGLWAELFVIAKSRNVAQALSAWHVDRFERFDFSWGSGCLEVKAAIGELRQHQFALEQLQPPLGGVGYVASFLLRAQSGGVGIIDLGNEIESGLVSRPDLRQKLWENVADSLGNDFSERLDRTFDFSYATRNLIIYRMEDVPAPRSPNNPRITAVRFRVDLSTVMPSLSGTARSILNTVFL